MDLSTVAAEYESHVFKLKETFQETDVKGNNDLFNPLKTDSNSNQGHDSSSLFQVKSASTNLEVDNSLFSYSSFKKAMDLRTHNRTFEDDPKRTIFEDAEFFAKNYCYKLLPITFEQVDETVIQSEHNYSLWSLSSESDSEEDFSRTMDYAQIKKKNYKRRRTKFREENQNENEYELTGLEVVEEVKSLYEKNNDPTIELQERESSPGPTAENLFAVQPLDLSAAHLVQQTKTEPLSLERADSVEMENDEVTQLDSDKENMNGILVTITRPDEKESYQPCDLFLNDMARLVPWLIDKDCFEVDIFDRTCERCDENLKNRVYYVISEATWGLFQRTNERVILTNDKSLGQPVRKMNKEERPSFLVFDQFSLARCLAEYCQEIGGCFEYTCFEEKDGEEEEKRNRIEEGKEIRIEEGKEIRIEEGKEIIIEEAKKIRIEEKEEIRIEEENKGISSDQKKENRLKKEEKEIRTEEEKDNRNKKIIVEKEMKIEKKEIAEEKKKQGESVLGKKNNIKKFTYVDGRENKIEKKKTVKEKKGEVTMTKIKMSGTIENVKKNKIYIDVEEKQSETSERKPKMTKPRKELNKEPPEKTETKKTRKSQKSTSKSETSQKSDKSVIERRRRKCQSLPQEEPPRKRKKPAESEEFRRKTRSRKPLEDSKIDNPKEKKKPTGKQKKKNKEDVTRRGNENKRTRTLRSYKVGESKERTHPSKTKMETRKSGKR